MNLIGEHIFSNEVNYYGQRSSIIPEESSTIVKQDKPEEPKQKEWLRPLWFLFTVGWYVALSLIIPTGIGYWLDRPARFDTHPLLTLVGFGFGTIIAFYGLYRMLRRFYLEQKEKNTTGKLDKD
jgi:hypothetical protein